MEPDFAHEAFASLSQIDSGANGDNPEIPWQEMKYYGKSVPRLVCVLGYSDPDSVDGAGTGIPLYRHPVDEQPTVHDMTPTVQDIVARARAQFGLPFNHVLMQQYRSGDDSISQHSDKTLDIVPGTPILNISLGASRCFMIRSKSKLKAGTGADFVEHVALPHNSALLFGLETNKVSTHQIAPDTRAPGQRRSDERGEAFGGRRVSLTIRVVGTFVLPNGLIYGQGARTFKTRSEAIKGRELNKREAQPKAADEGGLSSCRENGEVERQRHDLAEAFRTENKLSHEFSWEKTYGEGFDVLTPIQLDPKTKK